MAKTRLAAIVFCCLLSTAGWAETTSPSLVVTPPQPKWSDLTVQQKILLAPLADDWDSLEYFRQKKWLGMVARFSTMTPEEQRRIQTQMQEWGKLTPAQRELARENFKAASQLSSEEKQEFKKKWEEYVNLPDDEKEKFKQQAVSKPAPKPSRPAPPITAAPLPPTLVAPAAAPVQAPAPPPASPPAATDAAPSTAAETTTKP
ncbi:MAG: hypothetical protein H6R17_2701 [Proteobacteria bacterium]|nr:hypothetical protein [Pseudomonadota bacterium]